MATEGEGLEGTGAPVSMGPECCSVTQPPRPWPQASSVSAQISRGPQLTTRPALWSLRLCLGSRAEGTKAGQGLSAVIPPPRHPVEPRGGGRMIQAWPLPMALPCLPRCRHQLLLGAGSQLCLHLALTPATPKLVISFLLPTPRPSCGSSGKFALSGPWFFIYKMG